MRGHGYISHYREYTLSSTLSIYITLYCHGGADFLVVTNFVYRQGGADFPVVTNFVYRQGGAGFPVVPLLCISSGWGGFPCGN